MLAGHSLTRGDIVLSGGRLLIVWDHDHDYLGCYRADIASLVRVETTRSGAFKVGRLDADEVAELRDDIAARIRIGFMPVTPMIENGFGGGQIGTHGRRYWDGTEISSGFWV